VSKAADKSRRKSETSELLVTQGFDDTVMNGEKSSFSRMMFVIGRLESIDEVVDR